VIIAGYFSPNKQAFPQFGFVICNLIYQEADKLNRVFLFINSIQLIVPIFIKACLVVS